jgi:hypothetical protein
MPSRKSIRRERRWFRPLRLEPLEQLVLPGFVAPLAFDAGSSPYSVAVGDFNGDGIPDLATPGSVLLGNGDGSFQAPRTFSAGNSAQELAVGDFNGDGIPDLAVVGYSSDTVSVLRGNGDGTFQAARFFAVGAYPSSVAVGDFNRDGSLDLAVADSGYEGRGQGVSVLLGNGDGTFQAARNFAAGSRPQSVAVGDFNGDGTLDLAVANYGSYPEYDGTVSVLLGNGDGSFQDARNFAVGTRPQSVAVGDFNGDGTLDLAVADTGYNGNGQGVNVLLGNGDGSFQDARYFAAGNEPDSVAVGDFNGDGTLDLAVANYYSNTVSVLLGNGDGSFQAAVNYAAGSLQSSVAVGDFNGDGALDLAVANYRSNDVSILLNDNAWAAVPRRPGGQPPGDGRAAAGAIEPRVAPVSALPRAPDVFPSDTGMAALGSPWAMPTAVPGPRRLPFRVDADPGAAAAAPAPLGAGPPAASVGGALQGGPPALVLWDRLFAEPTSGWGGDLLAEQPWSAAW